MREKITLNRKEQTRAKVIAIAMEKRCTSKEAADLLGLSERHLLRLKKGFREAGPEALAHGNRGRSPVHAIQDSLRRQVLELARTQYAGYNHTHLHEELVSEQGVHLSRRSVARILQTAGMRSPKRRRARKHRSWRERMPKEGMMLQVDGSQHDWLEGRGPRLVLLGAVDDATGTLVHALFRQQEDAQGYLTLLREAVHKRGIPLAWYSDRHGIFARNGKEAWTLSEELAGRRKPTQVARALEQLGVNLILARTPQAKGRIERCWGTLQDRLVKALRRQNARTLADANQTLASYLPQFNKRFARPAADPQPAYRLLPRGTQLDAICSFHYTRTVANDNTVRLEERLVHVPPGPKRRSYAHCRVQVQERLDGSLAIYYQGSPIAHQPATADAPLRARPRRTYRQPPRQLPQPAPTRPKPQKAHSASTQSVPTGRQATPNKPPSNHPWRNSPRYPVTNSQTT
jgi:transposase